MSWITETINAIEELQGLPYRIGCLVLMIYILYRSYFYYNKKNRRTTATEVFITLQFFVFLSILSAIALSILSWLFDPIPYIPFVIIKAFWYFVNVVIVVYNLEFVMHTLSIHPKEMILKVVYILAGGLLGLIFVSMFSTYNWVDHRNGPTFIIYMTLVLESITLIIISYYAFISYRSQSLLLLKKTMQHYLVGYLIYAVNLISLFILQIAAMDVFSNMWFINLILLSQMLCLHLMFIAYFQPPKFKHKYRKEKAFIEKMFENVNIK